MGALGIIEAIESADSFASETASPVTPGASRIQSASTMQGRSDDVEASAATAGANVDATLAAALALVDSVPSSTTFSALALAYEIAGDVGAACIAAVDALELCVQQAASIVEGEMIDPLSAQLALEILFRNGRGDDAVKFGESLPLTAQMSLTIAALLASKGRLEEAHRFADNSHAPLRDSVLGYVFVLEHDYHKAISHLRAALRRAPDDSDSAVNLSIAFWRVGSRKRALSAALQATRAGAGRMDAILHYLELLLEEKEFQRVDREVQRMFDADVAQIARLLVMQARAKLGEGEQDQAMKLLERAAEAARREHDDDTLAEVRSNLIRMRSILGRIDRDEGMRQLISLHDQHRTSGVVVVNLAQIANRKRHAHALRKALGEIGDRIAPNHREFVEYQIANLSGELDGAAIHAAEWVKLDSESTYAWSAAMVALGIGLGRWDDATDLAERALAKFSGESTLVNNIGYTFAMTGRGQEAIQILEPHADADFVVQATLGLAYLSIGDTEKGMRLYRQAAILAEKAGNRDESLMTGFQALVVRQLGLLESHDKTMLRALALPAVALPDDWAERPSYLRLQAIAAKCGYPWPMTL